MVIFLRHGQTLFNKEHKFQGVSDAPLTDEGIQQAKAMGTFLKAYHPAKYILSPLPRVYQTYSYIRESADAPYDINPALSEISYGAWEGLTKQQASQDHLWHIREGNRFSFIHPGSYENKPGESYKQLYERLQPFFSEVFKKHGHENIAVIAHQGVMVAAKKYYENLSDDVASHIRSPNNTVLCVTQSSGSYTVADIVIEYGG